MKRFADSLNSLWQATVTRVKAGWAWLCRTASVTKARLISATAQCTQISRQRAARMTVLVTAAIALVSSNISRRWQKVKEDVTDRWQAFRSRILAKFGHLAVNFGAQALGRLLGCYFVIAATAVFALFVVLPVSAAVSSATVMNFPMFCGLLGLGLITGSLFNYTRELVPVAVQQTGVALAAWFLRGATDAETELFRSPTLGSEHARHVNAVVGPQLVGA